MCGIAGKVSPDRVGPDLIERMCAALEHRGPDSQGTFLDDGAGIGVRRLAVIDLETGDQPVFNEDRSVVVALNGEIYNYRELRSDLRRRGHRFSTDGDTEVIAHLYEERGDDCVTALRGMFALALWDRRRRRLLLARDRIGKKPLFYSRNNGSLVFGSEARAVLQDEQVPRDVSYDAVDCYLQYQYVPAPLSAFAALRKLPPAHRLTWEGGEVTLERYWRLSYADRSRASSEELRQQIRDGLLEATRMRLRSDVPVGAFLSGGVDSSAVVAAMARQTSQPVKTFSIGFDVPSFDETRYARQVARAYGTDHHEFRIEARAGDLISQLAWHYGEPFADPSALPSFELARLARRHVTVALNGDGGDENFAGYPRYAANLRAARVGRLPRRLTAIAARALDRLEESSGGDGWAGRLAPVVRTAHLPDWERYPLWFSFFTEAEKERLYTPELWSRLSRRTAPTVIRDPYVASDGTTVTERLLDVDTQTYLPDDLLVKMDIATMAHSLEARSPLLDHDFMEMAASLPANGKLARRSTKRLFKDAVRDWLPPDVVDRPKMGFSVPLATWFRGQLRDLPHEILLDGTATGRGLFRAREVERMIEAHRANSGKDYSNQLWALIQLEMWFRSYIDPPVPRPPA
ncbi:MAG TPA: asparagine synthase (glutamine-hydrolyzing) [Solirubrobacteraceae bacterium]|nr:asparagine synthase (glutamine-hydrolyzing) [Solirubrobacteraceae bacterium]